MFEGWKRDTEVADRQESHKRKQTQKSIRNKKQTQNKITNNTNKYKHNTISGQCLGGAGMLFYVLLFGCACTEIIDFGNVLTLDRIHNRFSVHAQPKSKKIRPRRALPGPGPGSKTRVFPQLFSTTAKSQ